MAKGKGAPRKFTVADVERALVLIASGVAVKSLSQSQYAEQGIPSGSVIRDWLRGASQTCPMADFASQYARAMDERVDLMTEEIIEIVDESGIDISIDDEGNPVINGEAIARAKLRAETRLKLMAIMSPKKYGNRLALAGDAEAPVQVRLVDDILGK